jgi:hypothetical protein
MEIKIVSFGNKKLLAPSTPKATMVLQELELLPLQISQISLRNKNLLWLPYMAMP